MILDSITQNKNLKNRIEFTLQIGFLGRTDGRVELSSWFKKTNAEKQGQFVEHARGSGDYETTFQLIRADHRFAHPLHKFIYAFYVVCHVQGVSCGRKADNKGLSTGV